MRKKCLQVFSIFLIVCLLLTAAPLTGMPELFSPNAANAAAVHSNSDLKYGSDNSITRVEWLHDLTVLFNMTVTDDNMPDNYFSDLEETDSYYYDVMLAVEFGVVDVEAGGSVKPLEKATREFAAQTLNFCLGYYFEEDVTYTFSDVADTQYPNDAQIALDRGWVALVDGKFMPALPITSAEIKTMLDDAQTIYNGTEIDTSHEDSIVFKNNVLVIPPETESEIVNENTVTITDCPISLKQGDLFAVYDGEFPVAYHVQSLSTSGNVTTVTTTTADLDEAYEKYDVEGSMESDALSVIPTEGVEVETIQQRAQTKAKRIGAKKVSGFKTLKSISTKIDLSLGSGDTKLEITGACKMTNPTLDYRINKDQIYVVLSSQTELSFSVTGKGGKKLEQEYPCYTLGIPLVGGFEVSVSLGLSGKANCAIKGTLTTGIEWRNGDHPRMIKGFQREDCFASIEASLSVGLKAKLGLYKTPIVKAYIYGEIGVKGTAKLTAYTDGKKPSACMEFSAYLYAKVGATGEIKVSSFFKESIDLSHELINKNNSPWRVIKHYDDGVEVATCGRGKKIGADTESGDDYFTPATSRNYGSGWSEASGSKYGYNKAKEPIIIFDYEIDENNYATITKYYGNANSVVIPKAIDGYTVKAIGYSAFSDNNYLGTVIIPDTITEIHSWAFSECKSLRQINLPENLETLERYAFYECDSLMSINIPKSLVNTGDFGPFYNCSNLRTIIFEKGITKIVARLFDSCDGLEEIVIPDTVTEIGYCAFNNCSKLKQIKLSDSLTLIDGSAFSNCDILETIELPDSLF